MPVDLQSTAPAEALPLRRLLVANRGEIAVRILRACRELGLATVAVYTEPDRQALHVQLADEAYSVGEDPLAGYLDIEGLLAVARASGCDSLHPGYGFLAENPELAAACQREGLVFVGPGAEVIRRMGDKTAARQAMLAAGVPVTPGSDPVADLAEACREAARLGYPVMLKAAAGGGGRGIRRCDDEAELKAQYPRVLSEARRAFGSTELYLERCLLRPRHIEVQVLADAGGRVVHLYERDCSIQRRNQKLVEVAPSPGLTPAQRAEAGALAVRAAEAIGYENAGTVEFLLADGHFHFMEMNTRIQVEHSITEAVTGVDLVREQLRIAAGLPLALKQEEIQPRGWAIQLRINAEDPGREFLPTSGRIHHYREPGGPGVRVDTALYQGCTVTADFDSLCLKLIVHDEDWSLVLRRGLRALQELRLDGVITTADYCARVLASEAFRSGRFDTGFVDDHPELLVSPESAPDLAAIVAAAIAAQAGSTDPRPATQEVSP